MKLNKNTISKPEFVRPLVRGEETIKTIFKQPYARSHAAGWWSDLSTGIDKPLTNESIKAKEVLIMTELAEAVEGDRKNLMDDKLPHRKMVEVELADAVIRAMDLSGAMGSDINSFVIGEPDWTPEGYDYTFTDMIHYVCKMIFDGSLGGIKYTMISHLLIKWGDHNGYDVIDAMVEKMEFNSNRPDHKIENRKGVGGKTY